jgi:hypothetical protein
MSLLTELMIFGGAVLQICRADGAETPAALLIRWRRNHVLLFKGVEVVMFTL